MKKTTMTLRINPELKKSFQAMCQKNNIDMSSKINQFILYEMKEYQKLDIHEQLDWLFAQFGYPNVHCVDRPTCTAKNGTVHPITALHLTEKFTLTDFLEKNKKNQVYIFFEGSDFPNELRMAVIK